MFTDIVGYTRLMQESEAKAVTLRNRHREVIDSVHGKYRGKVIQYLGDGTLSIFESTSDSVEAAIEIQQQLQEDPNVPLRIGLHMGDVMVTESDIIGNGVNLASRIESLGVAGAILISEKVMEEIKNQPIPVKRIGTFHLKNDEFPRDVFAIAVKGLVIPKAEELNGKLESGFHVAESGDPKQTAQSISTEEISSSGRSSMDDQFEQNVREIIDKNLLNPQFSVEVLCKEVGYSRPQLYRKLQSITGHSPSDFIREIRLQKAAGLLKKNTGNVSEIAFQTGFNNLSYFSKVFQERFGSTPSEFAKVRKSWIGIPVSLTQFIGREKEMQDILEILGRVRLLTLTGIGGTGKTRLALEVLSQIGRSIVEEACFVQLAPVGDPEQILPKIAQILKVQQDPTRDNLELIIEFIRDRKMLLVLDNFEHVIAAAPGISQLLQHCSQLKILVTSRVVLNLKGENEYAVPQLAVPQREHDYNLAELQNIQSVQLFIDRVKSIKPNFNLNENNQKAIIDICTALDGLPLAIELAAARMKLFSPEALLKRLSNNLDILKSNSPDQPERHRTLTNAIDWSYSLLAPEEQTLFRRLSIFSGGCTIEAAETICFHDYAFNFDIVDSLSGLVDKSLIQREDQADGEPRFFMLETIKAFGQIRSEKSLEKEDLMDRYVDYFKDRLEGGEGDFTGPKMDQWLALIDTELDNLRAILAWIERAGEAETGLQFALSFWRYWTIRSMMREGAQWLKRMLDIPAASRHSVIRCKALNAYGVMFGITRRIINAKSIFHESLEIARKLDYEEGIARALNYLSWIHQFRGDFDLCDKYSTEALTILSRLDNQRDIAATYNNMAFSARLQGKLPLSVEYYQIARDTMKGIGDRRGYAYNLCCEAWVHAFMGHYALCNQMTEEALEILVDKQIIAFAQSIRACNFCFNQAFDEAEPLLTSAIPKWKKSGNFYGEVLCNILELIILFANGAYDQVEKKFSNEHETSQESIDSSFLVWEKQIQVKWLIVTGQWESALSLSRQNLYNSIQKKIGLFVPDGLEDLAYLYTRNELFQPACILFSFAQKLRNKFQINVLPLWQKDHNRTLNVIRENLPEVEFKQQWDKGQNSTRDTVLALIQHQ